MDSAHVSPVWWDVGATDVLPDIMVSVVMGAQRAIAVPLGPSRSSVTTSADNVSARTYLRD